jgi:hypothetical protein
MDIKPITIKPITPAGAPSADAAPAAPSAPSVPSSGIRPIAIKPMAAPTLKPAASGDGESATIRLKPVPPPGAEPAAPASVKPIPLKPTPLSAPPAGPAAAPVPMQALKGKTSRISLDSALSSPPTAAAAPAMGKLTSNLSAAAQAAKGQTAKVSLTIMDDDAMTRHQTLRMKAPAAKPATPAPVPAKPADDASEAPTIRKKTLVLKKDAEGAAPSSAPASGGDDTKPTLRLKPTAEGGAPGATKPKITLKGKTAAEKDEEKKKADEAEEKAAAEGAAPGAPGAGFDPSMVVQKPEKTNPVFPIFAIASILVAMFTIILFMSERSSTGGADLSYTKLVFRYGPNSEHAGEPMGFPVFAGKQWQCPGLPRVTLFRR